MKKTAFCSNWQEKSFFNFFYIHVGSACEKYQLGDYLANLTNVKKKIKQDKSALPLKKKKKTLELLARLTRWLCPGQEDIASKKKEGRFTRLQFFNA